MSYLGKRQRGQTAQTKAYWANRRFNSLYPWSDVGAARVKRGSDFSLQHFGKSYKSATADQKMARKATGFTGRGKYGHLKKLGHSVQKFAKKQHLAKRGMDIGMAAASRALTGSGLYGRGLYGRGSYSTSNVLIEGGQPAMGVSTGASDNQEVIISHCEYIQDVFGPSSANFDNQGMSLNAGLMETFPWLAQIAANYEEYEFIQLVFHYRSTVDAGNQANGATGTVILATNYNGDQSDFKSKEPMVSYHGAVSGRLTSDIDHGVECDPSKNAGTAIRYIRTNQPLDNQSKKEFDLGRFQFAVVNCPSGFLNQQIGELWATYTVKLNKPRLFASVYRNLAYDRTICTMTTSSNSNGLTVSQCWRSSTTEISGGVTTTSPSTSIIGDNQQNILGVKVQELSSSLTAGATGTNTETYSFQLVFPDYMTGTFLIVSQISTNYPTVGTADFFTGDEVLNIDNYATPDDSSTASNVVLIPKCGPGFTADVASNIFIGDQRGGIMEITVAVTPAVAGVDNTLNVALTGCPTTFGIDAAAIKIIPLNASLTDKFTMADGSIRDLAVDGQPYKGYS